MIGRRELRPADLGALAEALCREALPSDLDQWGVVEEVDQLGFTMINRVTRWPGVASIRLRPWSVDHPGECHLVLAAPIRVPTLGQRFDPVRDTPRPPGSPSARLASAWDRPDLPTRATVLLELDSSQQRVVTITFVTENMERYR